MLMRSNAILNKIAIFILYPVILKENMSTTAWIWYLKQSFILKLYFSLKTQFTSMTLISHTSFLSVELRKPKISVTTLCIYGIISPSIILKSQCIYNIVSTAEDDKKMNQFWVGDDLEICSLIWFEEDKTTQ
jgi:hypothetical protein